MFDTPSGKKWQRIGIQRRSGVLVPLFSVYSRNSFGIGDLADLKLIIDWAEITGNSVIQLLPMNEVGSLFCPYDSLSSFALEPAYISLGKRGWFYFSERKIGDGSIFVNKNRTVPMFLDYALKQEKIRILQEIFNAEKISNTPEFLNFKEKNAYWLFDFALYKTLKDYHHGAAWYEWEIKFKERDKLALDSFAQEHKKEIEFQVWLQWQLYKQFKDVKEYAAAKKVFLKGDLPILVSRDSADVWQHRGFFKLDFAAGAPPDMYCAKGQRWGMPTYDWEAISADGYRYLKEKLKYAEELYDILRIDHVVGLFRIWSIPYNEPLENKGLNGFFDPQDESLWRQHGNKILTAINDSTDMLLCAEDLGIIPRACTDTLKDLGIPGNDVQRWVKDWQVEHDFLKPSFYRKLSVAMLSTHDTTNWPAWWENEAGTVDEALFIRKCNERGIDFDAIRDNLFNPDFSCHSRLRWLDKIDTVDKLIAVLGKRREELADFIELYENSYLEKEKLWKQFGVSGAMREKSDAEIVKAALKISLDSSAIFCINTIFDWLCLGDSLKGDPYQYRINTPGTISAKNWSLALPMPLEDLLKQKINKEIRQMIKSANRI